MAEYIFKKRLLLFILFLSLVLRLWGITFGLPDIDHPDESEVVNHAARFGSGDLNPHRFQYGSLFQYILFSFYGLYFLAGYITGACASVHQFAVQFVHDPTVFYLIARGLSATLGTATVLLTYLIGQKVKNEAAGLAGALFLAVSYEHVIHSHYCTVDTALTFFFTAAVYLCLRLFHDDRLHHYIAAGLVIGLATATKFNGIIASVVLLAAHFLRGGSAQFLERCFSRKLWIGFMAIFIGHFVACPFFYINLGSALSEIAELKAIHASSHFTVLTYLRDFMGHYWGIPLGAVCLIGSLRSAITTDRKKLVLFIAAGTVLVFASQYHYVEAKYILYSFPVFAVLGALFFTECCGRMKRAYTSVIMVLLIAHPLSIIAAWDHEHAQKSINLEAKEWIEATIKINSRILLDNVGNEGPKLENAPEQLHEHYERALKHKLLKADYLKLKLESQPKIYYRIYQVDSSAGSRMDDYLNYRLWQDVEEIGHPPAYYRQKGFDYIIVAHKYFSKMVSGFKLIKEFKRGDKAIRIYSLNQADS